MKRLLLILLCLLAGTALAEEAPEITVTGCTVRDGAVQLAVCSRAGESGQLSLVCPFVDDEPVFFEDGSEIMTFELDADGESIISFATEAMDGQTLTVLLGADGKLFTRLRLSLDGTSFSTEPCDEPILENASPVEATPLSLTDSLTEEQVALLDYGQAVICLCDAEGHADSLQPVCTVPARVSPEGQVQADWSGLLLQIDGFCLRTEENGNGGMKASLALTGDAVFYAEVDFQTASGEKTRELVSSAELEGTWENVPRSLFDTATLTSITISLESGKPVTVGGDSRQLALTEPLQPQLVPIAEAGSFGWYFEYFFTDGTDTVHPFQPYHQE